MGSVVYKPFFKLILVPRLHARDVDLTPFIPHRVGGSGDNSKLPRDQKHF